MTETTEAEAEETIEAIEADLHDGALAVISFIGILELAKTSSVNLSVLVRQLQAIVGGCKRELEAASPETREELLEDLNATVRASARNVAKRADELVEGIAQLSTAAQSVTRGFRAIAND